MNTIDHADIARRLGITEQQFRAWVNGNVDYDLSAITDAIVTNTGIEIDPGETLAAQLAEAGIIADDERDWIEED